MRYPIVGGQLQQLFSFQNDQSPNFRSQMLLTRKANQAEYSARMHRVVEHIDRHLDQELDLRALARVAHFSAFHFHRVFFSWTGETLGDYLRRRRLEIAAIRLAGQPKLSILNVAVSVGFGSTEAFARAFKVRVGCTASTWRSW